MNNWISVNDRLPEHDEYVLTYSKDHAPPMQIGFYSTVSKRWLKTQTAYPAYWMPLPSPADNKS